MVARLFPFVKTNRLGNWKLKLGLLEDMVPDSASIDCINYWRLSPVYTTDMKHLEKNDTDT